MDVSNKILEKYEVLQHQYLKDTGCDSLLLRHKKTGQLLPTRFFVYMLFNFYLLFFYFVTSTSPNTVFRS